MHEGSGPEQNFNELPLSKLQRSILKVLGETGQPLGDTVYNQLPTLDILNRVSRGRLDLRPRSVSRALTRLQSRGPVEFYSATSARDARWALNLRAASRPAE